MERRKQIEIETQEINRKDCELSATVKLPAEAESYRVQMIAEGKRTQTVENAKAEAERIKKLGAAEAHAIEMVGKAEAERMRMKANVYKQYGDAAIMNIVLESLPKVRLGYDWMTSSNLKFIYSFRLRLKWQLRWPRPKRSF